MVHERWIATLLGWTTVHVPRFTSGGCMSFLSRIYFNAVYGALGGLLGWLLFGVFGEKNPTRDPVFLPAQVIVMDVASDQKTTFLLVRTGDETLEQDHVSMDSCVLYWFQFVYCSGERTRPKSAPGRAWWRLARCPR